MAGFNEYHFFQKVLRDIRIELADEFDRNFRRKGFFKENDWKAAKHPPKRGSLMMRTGDLRNSISARNQGEKIIFTSSRPDASIHNEGGKITVTTKMKKFFWAMYYKSLGNKTKRKDGSFSNSKRNNDLNADAQYWKSLALMKTGSQITIPERRFIGQHPTVDKAIKSAIEDNLKDLDAYINQLFKK